MFLYRAFTLLGLEGHDLYLLILMEYMCKHTELEFKLSCEAVEGGTVCVCVHDRCMHTHLYVCLSVCICVCSLVSVSVTFVIENKTLWSYLSCNMPHVSRIQSFKTCGIHCNYAHDTAIIPHLLQHPTYFLYTKLMNPAAVYGFILVTGNEIAEFIHLLPTYMYSSWIKYFLLLL